MNMREAKRVVLSYLVEMLDPVKIDNFVLDQSEDNDADWARLEEARKQLQHEMLRRLGKSKGEMWNE